MKAGQGKNKGSSYERKIGEKISLWLSKGERKDLLCRTVGSGAQFTSHFNRGLQAGLAGDLRSQDPLADRLCNRYVIECKHWRDLEFLKFLDKKGMLYDAMVKVQQEGKTVGKSWMLIARQNNRPDILITSSTSLKLVCQSYVTRHYLFGGEVGMYFLDEVFEKITPEEFLGDVTS